MDKEKIFAMAKSLATEIENSECLRDYNISKNNLKDKKELLDKLELFKKLRFEYQSKILANIKPALEEDFHISKLYSDLCLNDDINLFLKSERESLALVSEVLEIISLGCNIDINL